MIKKLIVSLFFVIPLVSQAQISGLLKDDFIFTGKMNVSNSNVSQTDGLKHRFNLSMGVMSSSKLSVGIDFGFFSDENVSDNFSIGVFARHYTTPKNTFSFLTKSSLLYFKSQGKNNDISNGFSLILNPGVSYFLTNRLAIEAYFGNIGYTTSKKDGGSESRSNKFDLGFDARNISFGILLKGK